MSDQVVNHQELSIPFLKQIFDDAYFTTSITDDGDLCISGNHRLYVELAESKRFVKFTGYFRQNENTARSARLEYVNRVNLEMNVIRAYCSEKVMYFDQYLWVEGGITRKCIITAFKFFEALVDDAIKRDRENVLA